MTDAPVSTETRMRAAPTIVDVARAANVSVPTVSRVLTGSTPVSAERRDRVHRAIRELGYHPNGAARALVRGHQSIVAVLTSNTTGRGQSNIIKGIEEAARADGFLVVIMVLTGDDGEIDDAVRLLLSQPIAGAIAHDVPPNAAAALDAIRRSMPLVTVGFAIEGDPYHVALDVVTASAAATRYLLQLGHPTVHLVTRSGFPSGRGLGWRNALAEAGAIAPEPVATSDDAELLGYDAGRALALDPAVSAVLCADDETAFGVIRGLLDGGRRVPDDVSIVSFDDSPLAAAWTPRLSSVQLDFVGLGRASFRGLRSALSGEAPPRELDVPRLVVRDSARPYTAR